MTNFIAFRSLKFFRAKSFLYTTFLISIFPSSLFVQLHSTVSRPISIAIIDTGVDIKHPNLINDIWINPGESGRDLFGGLKSENGIDDDKNGYIDDVYGWNFVQNNSSVNDFHGHGTHIAGVVKGIFKKKKIYNAIKFMVLKYYDSNMSIFDQRKAFLSALKYAVNMDADIINISGGGRVKSEEEIQILSEAAKRNILVVASAGNKSKDKSNFLYYPAAYNLNNIISVVATDSQGMPLSTSNSNANKINVYAPGKKLYSTLPGNKFGFMTGSSQATAVVTAFAAIKKLRNILLF